MLCHLPAAPMTDRRSRWSDGASLGSEASIGGRERTNLPTGATRAVV